MRRIDLARPTAPGLASGPLPAQPAALEPFTSQGCGLAEAVIVQARDAGAVLAAARL